MKDYLGNFKNRVSAAQIKHSVGLYLDDHPLIAQGEPLLLEHVQDETPHPVYDNLPAGKFVTLFKNRLV